MLRTLRHTLIVPLCVLGLSPHADDSHDPRLEAILGAANSIDIVCDYTYTHAHVQLRQLPLRPDGHRRAAGRPPKDKRRSEAGPQGIRRSLRKSGEPGRDGLSDRPSGDVPV